jgi:4'-phosphopantetheinyl transferase
MMEASSLFQQSSRAATGAATARVQTWRQGPKDPAIWQNEVHVWRTRLDLDWSWTMDEALTLEDRARADRFRFESDRRRFCVARASMRIVLARYLKLKPSRLQIELGDYGKPFFADAKASQGLRFNLSHSNQIALMAVTRDREVGIDVEYMRHDFATNEVADHFFSPAEVQQFRSTPSEMKTQSFFNGWTRKEAYIKARGEGLSCPLDQFDVSIRPDERPMLLNSRVDPDDVSRWAFQNLHAGEGYAAALAVEGQYSRLVLWDFAL